MAKKYALTPEQIETIDVALRNRINEGAEWIRKNSTIPVGWGEHDWKVVTAQYQEQIDDAWDALNALGLE